VLIGLSYLLVREENDWIITWRGAEIRPDDPATSRCDTGPLSLNYLE